MIDFITQNKGLVIIGVILLLLFNNRDKFAFLLLWPGKVDRKNLYDCLIQLQDYLAICGVDRGKMDGLTLAEVGELTVSATTPLKPSRESDGLPEESTHGDNKLLDIQ